MLGCPHAVCKGEGHILFRLVTLLIAPTSTSFSAVETLVTKQQIIQLAIMQIPVFCWDPQLTLMMLPLALPSPVKIANFAYFHCLLILPNEVILYSTLTHLYNHANIHTTNLVETYFFSFCAFCGGSTLLLFTFTFT